MSGIFGFLASLWGRFIGNAFLGPIAPVVTGIAQLIGGIISAVAEIVTSLAKSPEGRVALCLIAGALAFLYLRFHYFEEGRAQGRSEAKPKIVAVQKPCPAPSPSRSKR